MDFMNIQIISMKGWGELGNWLSGKSLATLLQEITPKAKVSHIPANEFILEFINIGKLIKQITLESENNEDRYKNYSHIMQKSLSIFPPNFENAPLVNKSITKALEPLTQHFIETKPDIVIGTKGIICRVAIAALRLAEHNSKVINYVTNHMHFQFPLHHCPTVDHHLVRLNEAKEYITNNCQIPSEKVSVIGYPIAAHEFSSDQNKYPIAFQQNSRTVIIFSNRGGPKYLELLNLLIESHYNGFIIFVGLNDPELCKAAAALLNNQSKIAWRVYESLEQSYFLNLINEVSSKGEAILISKSSPNMIFEAIYFSLPMLLIDSGLPMEQWSIDFVKMNKLGLVVNNISEAKDKLGLWLLDSSIWHEMSKAFESARFKYLNKQAISFNLSKAIKLVTSSTCLAAYSEE